MQAAKHRHHRSARRARELLDALSGARSLLIVLQDSPDPDALAAAAALRQIANRQGIACTVVHGGVVGRAENAALVRYLGLSLRAWDGGAAGRFDRVAMVDTQPGTGNNAWPAERPPDIVVDHHPLRPATRRCTFRDIRRCGAASTIFVEYLRHLDLLPDMPLATALLYGIRSDTQDLGREATRADIAATLYLYPLASQRTLSRIQNAVVPREYFAMLSCALRRAVVGGRGVFCSLGSTANPDMVGELADLLLRYEGCTWVLTCGLCGAVLRLSLRCRPDPDADAGSVVSRLVGSLGTGGGHGAAAGGQVPCPPRRHAAVVRTLKQRFLRFVGSPPAGLSPLVPRRQQTLPGKILRIL